MRLRAPAFLLPVGLIATYFVYFPGLSGTFQFDDLANLDALGYFGGVNDWQSLWRFVLEGGSGPLGRPITLLSFLLDGTTWPPGDAQPFLHTNLLLHLLCGSLVGWLALLVARSRGYTEPRAEWIAVVGASLWLLHPFWVSTTLYVVQRMTILAALFTLAGLTAYVAARRCAARDHRSAALALLVLSVPVFGGLGVLSKENAALLPLLVLSLDATVLRGLQLGPRTATSWRIGHWVLVRALAAAVLGYLVWKLPGFIERAEHYRPYSLGERLLTQPRIVFDYLFQLAVPRPQTAGLFHDNVVLSRGPLEPPPTLPALAGLLALLGGAWWARKRFPVATMGILFFLAGHVMESTVVPLELYFEHRNYLPAVGLFIAAGCGVVELARWSRPTGALTGAAAVTLLATLTLARASLWGDPLQLALVWARESPDSARARTQAAIALQNQGQPHRALRQVEAGLGHRPSSIELQIHRRILHCRLGMREPEAMRALTHALESGDYSFTSFKSLRQYLADITTGRCRDGATAQSVAILVNAALANPIVEGSRAAQSNLHHLRGIARLHAGAGASAEASLERAMSLRPSPGLGLIQAAILASHDRHTAALAMLDKAQDALENDKRTRFTDDLTRMDDYYRDEIRRLRALIRAEG